MSATCAGCKWFSPITQTTRTGGALGECRRRSLMVFQRESEGRPIVTRWPQTKPQDFCGAFQPAECAGGAS